MNVLHSKLQAPKRRQIIRRQRLIRYFNDICQKKIITVTAGAGYGKTTLVVDALASQDVVSVWYRLDEQDTDVMGFVHYLYAAFRQHFPGSDGAGMGSEISTPGLKKQTALLHDWLVFLEKTVAQQAVLVLDDYHLVQDFQPINDAISYILDRLPDNVHLVIIGRKDLTLKVSALRAGEQILEISEKELSFTPSEIKRFFLDNRLLTDTHINDIHQSTGGWAASLVLLRYAFNKNRPETLSGRLDLLKQAPRYVFSYLKETVFDIQPAPVKEFMMKAALLPEIDTRRCSRIFNVDNAETMLKQMIEDHLMIFPVDDSGTVFYLHQLFREFLVTQLEKHVSTADICQLHCRIAREMEDDDVFHALNHFIEGHAFDEAVRLIETHELKFLLEGKINFLDQCLKKIPGPMLEANPQLMTAQAKLHTYSGNPRQAMDHLTKALLLFRKQDARENMVKCMVELGFHYYFTGYVPEAKRLLEQVIGDVEPASTTYIIAMTYLTFLSSVLGEFETAGQYYDTVWEVIESLPDFERTISSALITTSYSYTLYIKGHFETSLQVTEKLLKSVLEFNIEPCLPLAYYQLAAASFYLGRFENGVEFGKKGIDICEKLSLADSRKGWVYLAWAQNCLGLGHFNQALDLITRSIELFEDPGNRWGVANALDCRHQVLLCQGKAESAEQALSRAIDIIDGYGLPLTEGILGNSRANLLIIEKNYSPALDCLETARAKLDGAEFHLFRNHLLASRCHVETGMIDEAFNHLLRALHLSRNNAYGRFLKTETEWLLPLFKTAVSEKMPSEDPCRAYLLKLFVNELTEDPPELNITLMGQFKLTAGNRSIPPSQWKSSKALTILKYLAANRAQGFIPREALIEMLWPDEDLKKTGTRFNAAMSALRKTLEPDLSPKAPSAYVERKKDMYRLYADSRIIIDTEHFSDLIALARKHQADPSRALEIYLEAQSLCQGLFLEEDRYEDWCIRKRESFTAGCLSVLKEIVSIYEARSDLANAIHYAGKILEIEPFDENTFKNLMLFHAGAGNPANVRKTYAAYEEMAHQMDCPVSSEIQDLYMTLIPPSELMAPEKK